MYFKFAFSKFMDILELLILIRVLLSYIPSIRNNNIVRLIYQLTEPILTPVRELLFRIGLNRGMIDFSPIFAFLLLGVIRTIVLSIF